jgi:hypothetical protein
MKHLKIYEGKYEDLNYSNVLKLTEFDEDIKGYVEYNYPEYGYNSIAHHPMKNGKYDNTKKMITYGKSLGVGQAKRILALAKRKKDSTMLELLNKRLKNIKEVEISIAANKYNL